jgi:hypothetical protein
MYLLEFWVPIFPLLENNIKIDQLSYAYAWNITYPAKEGGFDITQQWSFLA